MITELLGHLRRTGGREQQGLDSNPAGCSVKKERETLVTLPANPGPATAITNHVSERDVALHMRELLLSLSRFSYTVNREHETKQQQKTKSNDVLFLWRQQLNLCRFFS